MSKFANKKVLLVDDMDSLRSTIAKMLKAEGFNLIIEAVNGAEAYSLIEKSEFKFDLVFSDINMPELNGIELVKKIRANADFTDIPIVMISTENEASIVMDAITAGATNYMIKPFSQKTLQDKLKEIEKHIL